LKETEEKLRLQINEATRRENVLVMRLANKEHEVQDIAVSFYNYRFSIEGQFISMTTSVQVNTEIWRIIAKENLREYLHNFHKRLNKCSPLF